MTKPARSRVVTALALCAGAALWLPSLHLLFATQTSVEGRQQARDQLLVHQLGLWESPAARATSLSRMRATNAEWDFMGRTFFVLSLANLALERPSERDRYVATMDVIIAETLRLERSEGQTYFLMAYARAGRFHDPSARSLFIDGEIAMMIAARERVAARPRWRNELGARVSAIEAQMQRGPVSSGESYPNECWTFCNAMALAALRVSDDVSGSDHGPLMRAWVANARAHLIDPSSGLLVSSYTWSGQPLDGPEGSSIFFVAHALAIVDPDLASDQYARAREQLGRELFGFGWAREWPASWQGPADVDSGPIVPVLDASAGASGLALLGAASFHDDAWLRSLHASLELAGFPERDSDGLRYAASNQVGDSVLLYSLAQGPLWQRVGPPNQAPVAMGAPQ